MPFDVQHDANEPLGFIIYDKISKEKLLYATDTYYIKYKFSNVNYLLLECNYITDIVKENRLKGKVHKSMYQRLLKSHFSLEHVLEFLKANDLSSVREIILCHLSDKNSDENVMIREVYNLTGIKTVVASSKMQLEFKLYPF